MCFERGTAVERKLDRIADRELLAASFLGIQKPATSSVYM